MTELREIAENDEDFKKAVTDWLSRDLRERQPLLRNKLFEFGVRKPVQLSVERRIELLAWMAHRIMHPAGRLPDIYDLEPRAPLEIAVLTTEGLNPSRWTGSDTLVLATGFALGFFVAWMFP